jgi:hypothetical protein
LSSGKKSFENLGRSIKKSGDTIRRMLRPASENIEHMQKLAQEIFRDSQVLIVVIDDTLIKKIYSQFMVGTGKFFDTKIGRKITAYRLIAVMVTNGKFVIPLNCAFMFAKELLSKSDIIKSKTDLAKEFIRLAQKLFPEKKLIVTADGLFSTIEMLQWCVDEKIDCEMRMHSNRTVYYRGKKYKLSKLKELQPCGRQMARTLSIVWHGINFYVTAEKRIDKYGEQTIVFLVSTYKAKPSDHVKTYKKRWPIEKVIRTSKQSLGLQECFSTKLETQFDHVSAIFLTYALVQWDMKKRNFDTPEDVNPSCDQLK